MENIYRLFVEKKKAHAQEARHLLADLKEHLNLSNLIGLRRFIRYDISGLKEEIFRESLPLVFTDPPVDQFFEETLPEECGTLTIIAWEYLPGQYDQRADSAEQALRIISPQSQPHVKSTWVVALQGDLSSSEVDAVKKYLINPVDSREASLNPLTSMTETYPPASDVPIIPNFITASTAELEALRKTMGLAMSPEDLLHCQAYFRDQEKRNPVETEIRLLDTYWSDHCRHTTFLSPITNIQWDQSARTETIKMSWEAYLQAKKELGRQDKPVTLMELATMGMRYLKAKGKLENLEESQEINACSIIVPVEISENGKSETREWLIMFKNETHNHPTEIEPFGGAATCLGGAIRDPLSGRSYVYQAMRITGSADPRQPLDKTLPGKLPQRKITREAARGYSSYGNQIGLATGLVREIYHPGYVAKRMEIGAVIAGTPRENVIRGEAREGDLIVVTGGRTGRDGCGGATGSSKEHTQESIITCGAEVQKGNPPTERKLQRLFRNPEASRLIKVCNDFGAGGVSVAIGELAESLDIDLDALPKKYDGLDGTELAISESQERMAVLLSPENAEAFIHLAQQENLEAVVVAKVTNQGRVRMLWRGKELVNLSRSFIDTNGVIKPQQAAVKAETPEETVFPLFPHSFSTGNSSFRDQTEAILSDLAVCSQKNLGEAFDSTIGAGTVLMPYGGKTQQSPVDVMAALIPAEKGETSTATLMSWGFHPEISEKSPYLGAAWAVTESAARLVASGASLKDIRLTFQEYFERLGDDPLKWGKPLEALLGAWEAQRQLEIAAIGGKDSMSGTFEELTVPPTLVSFSVAPLPAKRILPWEFQAPGNPVFFLPPAIDDKELPDFPVLRNQWSTWEKLVQEKKILSVRVTEKGGLAAALCKSGFGNNIGFQGDDTLETLISQKTLYGLLPGGILFESKPEAADGIKQNLPGLITLGKTSPEPQICLSNNPQDKLYLDEALKAWQSPLSDIFAGEEDIPDNQPIENLFTAPPTPKTGRFQAPKIAKPRVIIPVFPGTNCEYDTARAFRRAGAQPETLVFRNNSPTDIEESLAALSKAVDHSQILMIPGGFSAGDEPDGSGKFIAAVFRNPRLADAVTHLLENRDGLILGICNGFQALVKLGLVPWGKISQPAETDPTLTFNTVGRHISRMAETKILSTKSPWLSLCRPGEIHTVPLSHGEGRFYAPAGDIEKWQKAGQIATIYNSSNPNGSSRWIEGLTSSDGRVFGKMGHSERSGALVAVNIPGNKDQHIFQAGTSYFTD